MIFIHPLTHHLWLVGDLQTEKNIARKMLSYKDELVYFVAISFPIPTYKISPEDLKFSGHPYHIPFVSSLLALYFLSLRTMGKECEADLMNDSFLL